MEVFDKPPSSPNEGFTLLEVMISGALFMFFIFLGSQLIQQGVQERQKRQEILQILNHLDAWTVEIKQAGFFSNALTVGAHQRDFITAQGKVYSVQWHVQALTPLFKGITFQIVDPHHNKIRHEWKSSRLFEK